MFRSLRLAVVCLGSGIVVIGAGCQQLSAPTTAPGALPRHVNMDDASRINTTTLFAFANLLERQGAFERAIVQYQKAIELKPDFLVARNRLGITLNKVGRHDEATAQFRKCVEINPHLAYLYNNLGFSQYLQGNYVEAEQNLAHAIKLKPDFHRAHMNHAVVLAKLGRDLDAFNELQAIGSKADACFNMGILLTESRQYAKAAQYLDAALEANPEFEAARAQLQAVADLAAKDQARHAAKSPTARPAPRPFSPAADVGGLQTASQGRTNPHATIVRKQPPAPASAAPTLTIDDATAITKPAAIQTKADAPRPTNINPSATSETAPKRPAEPIETITFAAPIKPAPAPEMAQASEVIEKPAPVPNKPPALTSVIAPSAPTVAVVEPVDDPAPKAPVPAKAVATPAPEVAQAPVKRATHVHAQDAYTIVETIDLNAAPAAATHASHATPADTVLVAESTPTEKPDVEPEPTEVNTSTPAAKPAARSTIAIEEIEEVTIDPVPTGQVIKPAASTEALPSKPASSSAKPAKAKTAGTQQKPAPSVIIEDVTIDTPSDVDLAMQLLHEALPDTSQAILDSLRCRVEELLDPASADSLIAVIRDELAAGSIDTLLRDDEIRQRLAADGVAIK